MKLRYRIPLMAALAFFALVGSYVAIRSIQFAVSNATPLDAMPPADAYVRIVGIDGLFEKYRASGLRNLFRDKVIRPDVEAWLAQSNLPPLDKLEDEHFLDSKQGRVLRTLGRDSAVAIKRMPDDSIRVVAAFRLSYVEFLLAPFASLAPGFAGGARAEVAGHSAIRMEASPRPLYVVISGKIVIASDEPDLLAKALDPSKQFEPLVAGAGIADGSPGVRVELRLSQSPDMAKKVDAWLHRFPQGPALHFLDVEGMRGLIATVDLDGPRLSGEVRFVGGRVTDLTTDLASLFSYAPVNACLVQPTRSRGLDLWAWLGKTLKQEFDENDPMYFTKAELTDAVRLLGQSNFPQRVLQKLDGPCLLLLTVEKAPEDYSRAPGQPFLNRTIVFKAKTPADAAEAFKELCNVVDEVALENPDLKEKGALVVPGTYGGARIGTLAIKKAPTELVKIIQPCFALVKDAVILSMNEATLRKIIDASSGAGIRFADSDLWRTVRGPLQDAGLGDLQTAPGFSSMVTSGPILKSGNELFILLTAEYLEDNTEARAILRGQIEREWRAQRRPITDDSVTQEVYRRIKENIARRGDEMRRGLTFVDHVAVAAMRAQASETGYTLRWSLTLN